VARHGLLIGLRVWADAVLVEIRGHMVMAGWQLGIQFTPDQCSCRYSAVSEVLRHAPADGTRAFRFVEGRFFASCLHCADEDQIRASPRTSNPPLLPWADARNKKTVDLLARPAPWVHPAFSLACHQDPD